MAGDDYMMGLWQKNRGRDDDWDKSTGYEVWIGSLAICFGLIIIIVRCCCGPDARERQVISSGSQQDNEGRGGLGASLLAGQQKPEDPLLGRAEGASTSNTCSPQPGGSS